MKPRLLWRRSLIRKHAPAVVAISLVLVVALALIRALRTATSDSAPPRAKIDVSALDRIKPGMTEQEIAAMIGVPPGDYRTREHVGYIGVLCGPLPPDRAPKEWVFNTRCVSVWFTDGKAVYVDHGQGCRTRTWIEERLGVELFPLRD